MKVKNLKSKKKTNSSEVDTDTDTANKDKEKVGSFLSDKVLPHRSDSDGNLSFFKSTVDVGVNTEKKLMKGAPNSVTAQGIKELIQSGSQRRLTTFLFGVTWALRREMGRLSRKIQEGRSELSMREITENGFLPDDGKVAKELEREFPLLKTVSFAFEFETLLQVSSVHFAISGNSVPLFPTEDVRLEQVLHHGSLCFRQELQRENQRAPSHGGRHVQATWCS